MITSGGKRRASALLDDLETELTNCHSTSTPARDSEGTPMTSMSSQPRLETLVSLIRCDECCRMHYKCDKTFPVCNRCQKGGKTCVFPELKKGRGKLAASSQGRLSSNVELQLQRAEQQHKSSSDATSATDSAGTVRLDSVVSILERAASLPSSISIGRRSKRITPPPAVTKTRVRRCKQHEHVGLVAPKRRIRDKELINTMQASSRKRTSAPSKQSVCMSHYYTFLN